MTIAAAGVRPVTLRFARPVRTAQGEFTERRSVLLELHDAAGHAGFGEAAPWPGFGTESLHEATERLRGIAARIEGADLPSLEHETDQLAPAPAAPFSIVRRLNARAASSVSRVRD